MISVVLDPQSSDPSPRIIQGTLSCQIRVEKEWHAHDLGLTLALEAELPICELASTTAVEHPFTVELHGRHFAAWRTFIEEMDAGTIIHDVTAYLYQSHGPDPHITQSIQAWLEPWSKSVHILSTGTSGHVQLGVREQTQWYTDLGRTLDLASAIHDYVQEMRSQRRDDLLLHINNLIAASVL